MIIKAVFISLLALAIGGCQRDAPTPADLADAAVTVYRAANIITMDDSLPRAGAVAVKDGRIAAVGSLWQVRRSLGDQPYQLDHRFADKTLLPGFIEPHLHPAIAALLLPMHFITPHDWSLVDREVQGVRGRTAYLDKLRALEASLDSNDWLWTWGYHHLFHGKLARADLDAISDRRPMIVWHRSFHEIYANSAALKALGISARDSRGAPGVNWGNGHFYENGLQLILAALTPRLLQPRRYVKALRQARQEIHAGGITTVSDAAFGSLDLERELQALFTAGWDSSFNPFRTWLLLDGKTLGEIHGHEQLRRMIDSMPQRNGDRIRFAEKQVKLFADGAAYSQLMQLSTGYLDGHRGVWLMQPEALAAAARVYWKAGFQIHVHVNGDAALDVVLDILQELQREQPRHDHRFTVHHMAYARPDQAPRVAQLGAMVQANPYYLWALADKYAEVGLGPERAARMVPLQSFVEAGVRVALHSDFTMAPARPLLLAWAAATRITAEGNTPARDERLTLPQALRAITIDAAFQIGREQDIGSITVGKYADFAVLEQDPFAVPLETLKDIPLWGTVLEGRVFPLRVEEAEVAP